MSGGEERVCQCSQTKLLSNLDVDHNSQSESAIHCIDLRDATGQGAKACRVSSLVGSLRQPVERNSGKERQKENTEKQTERTDKESERWTERRTENRTVTDCQREEGREERKYRKTDTKDRKRKMDRDRG